MIDSMLHALPRARAMEPPWDGASRPVVVTLHRPSNVDDPRRLTEVAAALIAMSDHHKVVFPAHPRTRAALQAAGVALPGVTMIDPLGYVAMLALVDAAHAVVTDSGGLQEETTALGVPCFKVRDTTERPVTVREGTNRVVHDPSKLPALVKGAERRPGLTRPEGWDGRAGERVVEALVARL